MLSKSNVILVFEKYYVNNRHVCKTKEGTCRFLGAFYFGQKNCCMCNGAELFSDPINTGYMGYLIPHEDCILKETPCEIK